MARVVTPFRVWVGVATLSAAGLVTIVHEEDYRDIAYDDGVGVWTIGFGSTTHEDGTPVRPGERTTVKRALDRTLKDVEAVEAELRKCIKADVAQHEWDFAVVFSYNIGQRAMCKSGIVAHWNAGRYAEGCAVVKQYVYAQGRDCRIRENNCYGIIARREREYVACIGPS